ncbi:MAG: nitroreductase family protein [Tumebacillaceae bacterium]
MNFIDLITSRRNIKAFKPDAIARERILAWLEAASYAPNHRMTEPWEILFIGPETRAKLHHKTDFGGAPVVLAVLSTPAHSALDRDEHIEAVSCFLQNFFLVAHAEGVGTGWSSLGASPKAREVLGVQEGYDVVGLIPVGLPESIPATKPRTDIGAKIKELP